MKIEKNIQDKIYFAVTVLVLIISVVLVAGYLSDRKASKANEEKKSLATIEKAGEEKVLVTTNTEVILEGLENMGFLVTQEYYFSYIETYTKEKKVLKFFDSTAELAYSYDGCVTAGVDFTKIKIERDDTGKTITVDIPEAEIQTVSIDKDSFKVYSEKESMWNKLSATDFNDSLKELESEAKKRAIDNGILDRANAQAETLVMNFISNYQSVSNYKVICE